MKQTQEYILSEIKKTLQVVAPSAKAMLFGSRARNDAREDSDWDILIELGWNIGEMINPVLYTFNDWNKRSFTIFHKNVEEEGIAI